MLEMVPNFLGLKISTVLCKNGCPKSEGRGTDVHESTLMGIKGMDILICVQSVAPATKSAESGRDSAE